MGTPINPPTLTHQDLQSLKESGLKSIFLIDFENTSNTIFDHLYKKADPSAYYYVFISEHTQTAEWILKHAPIDMQFSFIQCETGENAMDFQLTATVGEFTALHPRAVYVIVSNDKGYLPAVHMLQRRGRRVFQYRPDSTTNKQPQKKKVSKNPVLYQLIKICCEGQGLAKYADTVYQHIQTNKLSELHHGIQMIPNISSEKVKALYKLCKKQATQRNLLS